MIYWVFWNTCYIRFLTSCLFKGQIGLGLGAESLRERGRRGGFLVAYFVVLLFNLAGLILQSGVFVFICSVACFVWFAVGWHLGE